MYALLRQSKCLLLRQDKCLLLREGLSALSQQPTPVLISAADISSFAVADISSAARTDPAPGITDTWVFESLRLHAQPGLCTGFEHTFAHADAASVSQD